MGAGKTTLVAGLARALDITMPVTSPTFTLVHELRPDGDSGAEVAHVDLYRLETYADVESLGLDEILDGTKIVVVEWGEVVGPMLGTDRLEIRLDYVDPDAVDARELTIRCHGDAWIRRRDELWTDLKDVLEVTD